MKIFTLIFLIIGLSTNTFSQVDNNHTVEIKNEDLREIIKEYNSYLKKWSITNRVENYLITLNQANYKDVSEITLNAVLYEAEVDLFNPSLYAMVDSIPVIIRSGLSVFLKQNKILASSIKKQFWRTNPSYQKIYDQQLLEYNKSKPDSILIGSKNGPVKVSTKSFVLVKTDLEAASIKSAPSMYILSFRGDKLVKKEISMEKRFQ